MNINRRMRRLALNLSDSVTARGLELPAGAPVLCAALCEVMAQRRGRPIVLRFETFPDQAGVTGLMLNFDDYDMILVEQRHDPVQQVVIVGHELWHLTEGHGRPAAHDPAAARALAGEHPSDEADCRWTDMLRSFAARSHCHDHHEREAESFGLLLGSRLRALIEDPHRRRPVRQDGISIRIQASLGVR
ncbi:toxin-antitoxin system, toxin component [Streptomyces sp. LE64]|uniref:toxin-antitoxin system, toxin component n=1 Tax=Streptomyces sp. LE64 TaxID=3448653 RepID=UPI0040413938